MSHLLPGFRAAGALLISEVGGVSLISHLLPGFRAARSMIYVTRIMSRGMFIHFRASRLSGHFGQTFYILQHPPTDLTVSCRGLTPWSEAGQISGGLFIFYNMTPRKPGKPGSLEVNG